MPRSTRADEAFGIYHALNRGNLRATIFHKEGDRPVPFELSKNIDKTPKSSVPVLSARKPWFPQGFSHLQPIALAFRGYPCMSMPAGAAPIEIVVSCAALVLGESSRESPESSPNPRFPREKMWFCSGGAGFELVEFES